MFSLKDKVAVVTGGASGIGKATAERFAAAGAKVVIGDLTDATSLADAIGGIAVQTNVSVEGDVARLMQTAFDNFGSLDIAINNAGVGTTEWLPDMTEEALDFNFNVNFKGAVWGIKHAARFMGNSGSIVNTASVAALFGSPGYTAYAASKAAIVSVTKTAALELAPKRIRVNCVCPGTVDTPMSQGDDVDLEMAIADKIHPLERIAQPEEIAALFHYLASDESAFITGQAIAIDGGMSAGSGLAAWGALYQQATGRSLDIDPLVQWEPRSS
ncbi:MAG: SDR family oxidoreductase [Actinomycetota bacterium]|nr:SDR family oxidoreductase [Actinomycetota bacterium]